MYFVSIFLYKNWFLTMQQKLLLILKLIKWIISCNYRASFSRIMCPHIFIISCKHSLLCYLLNDLRMKPRWSSYHKQKSKDYQAYATSCEYFCSFWIRWWHRMLFYCNWFLKRHNALFIWFYWLNWLFYWLV